MWVAACAFALGGCTGVLEGSFGVGGGGGPDGGGGGGPEPGGVDGSRTGTTIPGLPAFPGAEGAGAVATGGRGGAVYKVTTLDPTGPGSLGEAVAATGPRTVVFAVSGVIEGDIEIPNGDLTVAGQTAPGGGITIHGYFNTAYDTGGVSNIIVRHLRVRNVPTSGVGGDTIQFSQTDDVILDHISASWSTDELVDIAEASDVTIQWSTLEESDTEGHPEGEHNYAMLNGPLGRSVAIHHNLFAHHRHRMPALANGPSIVANNVLYDFRKAFHHDNDVDTAGFNIIGNYFKPGPSAEPLCFQLQDPGRYYFADNYIEGVGSIGNPCDAAGSTCVDQEPACLGEQLAAPVDTIEVTIQDSESAYTDVLARAGAWPRDAVTRRTITETMEGTGTWGRHEPSDLFEGLTEGTPPTDEDDDGIADSWEAEHGLDPTNGDDHSTVMDSGYTALEEYINGLADALVP